MTRFKYAAHCRFCGKAKAKASGHGKTCPICGKHLKNGYALGGHMNMHSKKVSAPKTRGKFARMLAAKCESLRQKGMDCLVAAKKLETIIKVLERAEG